jgi:tripartite-type tricarboxylate transporter receptor subunit TctC
MTNAKWLAAALCAALLPHHATAQNWPTKPVRFLTGFAVGGSSDQLARMIASQLSTSLGQQVIVDSRPGGNGVAGTALAAKAPADGYTYLVVFDAHATNPSLQKALPYDTLRDFTPVMLFASSPYGLVVAPASPYATLGDLIAAAKTRPGELTLGSSGVGSRGHLAMVLIEQRAGFKITQIAYRGPPQTITDVIGGQITMQMGTFFFVSPFIKSQRVRALAVTSAARMQQLPDIPTVAEQGFPGYEVHSWWGIVAPTGVPKAILQRLHTEMKNVLGTQQMRERLEQLGMTIRASTPEEFNRYLVSEMQLWGKVVRDAKISATQ